MVFSYFRDLVNYYLGNRYVDDKVWGSWCREMGMKFVVTVVDPCTTFSFFKNFCGAGGFVETEQALDRPSMSVRRFAATSRGFQVGERRVTVGDIPLLEVAACFPHLSDSLDPLLVCALAGSELDQQTQCKHCLPIGVDIPG